jgi:hypothetical protein
VPGTLPTTWLKSTRSPVHQQLRRYRAELVAFESAFSDAEIPVPAFVAGDAAMWP